MRSRMGRYRKLDAFRYSLHAIRRIPINIRFKLTERSEKRAANCEQRSSNKKTPPAGVGGAFGKILSSHSIISDATSPES